MSETWLTIFTPFLPALIPILIAGLAVVVYSRRKRQSIEGGFVYENVVASALMDVEAAAILVDSHGQIIYLNAAAEALFQCQLRREKGWNHDQLFQLMGSQNRRLINWLQLARIQDDASFQPCLLNSRSMRGLECRFLARPFRLSGQSEEYCLLLINSQSEVRALKAQLEYMRVTDQQTGLPNRQSLDQSLRRAMLEAEQHGVPHAYCHVRLDQFRALVDGRGHNTSDILLEQLCKVLKRGVNRERDVVARLGQDEFGLIFHEMSVKEALVMAKALVQLIAQEPIQYQGETHNITTSIGFVPLVRGAGPLSKVIQVGDAASQLAREKGGNRVYVYHPKDKAITRKRDQAEWVKRLMVAMEKQQFRLFAQAIHPLEPAKFVTPYNHFEILLRLFDEQMRPISPDEFIPAAEYYSLMPKIDRWVVTNLLDMIKPLARTEDHPVFSVNLSGQSLDDLGFLDFVQQELRRTGVKPEMLCFEITESVAIGNIALAQTFISSLRDLGAKFAMDDFGTGVSSFGYLKELPVNYLKIDGSFIKGIANDPVSRAMVESVHQVSQTMRLEVVAEYVENDAIINVLREIGVQYGQGYGIAKPTPLPQVLSAFDLQTNTSPERAPALV